MPDNKAPPATTEELCAAIVERFPKLSKRLQQIARYILDEPNEVALETLAVMAERSGVQPSAIVRFAQSFGFDGATQMQRLFRDSLLGNQGSGSYSERVRRLNAAGNEDVEPIDLLAEFVDGNVEALRQLLETVSKADMRASVDVIDRSSLVHIVGYRRSFPIASYLAYSLLQTGKKVNFLDGVAGLSDQHAKLLQADDLLIAISFQPYAEEALAIVAAAHHAGASILAITDSLVSPIAKQATHVLRIRESEVHGFRSLSASMCLAQALVINLAYLATKRGKRRRSSRAARGAPKPA